MVNDHKWCTARHFDPDATCELRYRHTGFHRAEYGKPIFVDAVWVAQVVTWE